MIRNNFKPVVQAESVTKRAGGSWTGPAGFTFMSDYYGQTKDNPKHYSAGVQG
jgi:hypothetical protein